MSVQLKLLTTDQTRTSCLVKIDYLNKTHSLLWIHVCQFKPRSKHKSLLRHWHTAHWNSGKAAAAAAADRLNRKRQRAPKLHDHIDNPQKAAQNLFELTINSKQTPITTALSYLSVALYLHAVRSILQGADILDQCTRPAVCCGLSQSCPLLERRSSCSIWEQRSGSGTAAANFNSDNGLVLLMWEEWPVVAYYVINLIK